MKAVIAALLCLSVSAFADDEPSDPIASYFSAVEAIIAVNRNENGAVNAIEVPQSDDPRYKAALDAAVNDVQRVALIDHWHKVQQCVNAMKRYSEDSDQSYDFRQKECVNELGEKAAAVEAAASYH